jgi:signal transduction histidine kinase
MRPIARIKALSSTLAARMALVLTLGVAATAVISLLIAEQVRIHDLEHARLQQVVASTVDMADRLARDPVGMDERLRDDRIFGARSASPAGAIAPDPEVSAMLVAQLGEQSHAQAMRAPRNACTRRFVLSDRVAGITEAALPTCWYVRFTDAQGIDRRLAIDGAPFQAPPSSTMDPIFLLLLVAASALLSIAVSRLITAPLRHLTSAARTFSLSIDPEPIPEEGPHEIRAALSTFNLMQHRVRNGFRERTQILASIAHDLQSPLTRLRLRFEDVQDEVLRERLIRDLAVTQRLVRDGLDLAHSSETREPWSFVDIDSILSSIAEDAAEFDADVRFVHGCGVRARVKPNALSRCLNNLVDNAVKYAGSAEIDCAIEDDELVIRVRDHGPGISESFREVAFEPFRRLDGNRPGVPGGTGLGLTIARAQAQTFGATLSLQNHRDGGLVATIRLDYERRRPDQPKPKSRTVKPQEAG